jgi:4-hydroxy-2-oxoheptanedioate aldolase
MSAERLLTALRSGRPAVEAGVSIPSVLVTEMVARSGVDGIWFDLQHGSLEPGDLVPLIAVVAAYDLTAVVRVGSVDPPVIAHVLDAGAGVIMCPDVRTPAEAEAFAAACRYAPLGRRGMGPSRSSYDAAFAGRKFEPSEENERVMAIVQIESPEGLENVEAIVATPGIDGVFPGMVDFSLAAYGSLPPSMSFLDDQVREPLQQIIAATHHAGKLVGLPAISPNEIPQLLELGADWIHCGGDLGWVIAGARGVVTAWREATA